MQEDFSPGFEQNEEERLTPKQLFQKHLNDPQHHVTDEELRNLKVGIEAEEKPEIDGEVDDTINKIKSVPDSSVIPNPYDVLK